MHCCGPILDACARAFPVPPCGRSRARIPEKSRGARSRSRLTITATRLSLKVPYVTPRYLRLCTSIGNSDSMPKAKPTSSTLMDLEWARVYADRIKDELKLIAKTLSDLNAHAMHPHLVKGAVALKAQMKEASQQVGTMRKIAGQYESNWMNTIKKALARKYPGFNDGKPGRAAPSTKKTARSRPARKS